MRIQRFDSFELAHDSWQSLDVVASNAKDDEPRQSSDLGRKGSDRIARHVEFGQLMQRQDVHGKGRETEAFDIQQLAFQCIFDPSQVLDDCHRPLCLSPFRRSDASIAPNFKFGERRQLAKAYREHLDVVVCEVQLG
eukprot:2882481-Rhodomonas_salina.1